MKTKIFVFVAVLLVGFAGWGLSHGLTVKAAPGFTLVNVKGTYGYTVQGTIGLSSPFAAMGVLTADGNGGISGTETSQVYGVGMQTNAFQGSYTVDNTGCGTITLNFPAPAQDPNNPDAPMLPGVTARYKFVIVNGMAEIRALRADNGTMATAEFKLQ
jgi:hypothetical protein